MDQIKSVKLNAIVLIVNEPNEIYLDFLTTFVSYDIYVIIDNNTKTYPSINFHKYKNINFIKIDPNQCKRHGFINVNKIGVKKQISGWDKALFFFSIILTNYNHIWFIEDDVFFYEEQIIIDLDNKYSNYDLLSNCDFNTINPINPINPINSINPTDWLWSQIDINLPKPHFAGMMCAVRISKNVLNCLKLYALKFQTLFFLEALLPTITYYYKLTMIQPNELTTITHREKWSTNLMNITDNKNQVNDIKKQIYHPIKDQKIHIKLRNI